MNVAILMKNRGKIGKKSHAKSLNLFEFASIETTHPALLFS